ncbi:MAG: hypothetical protein K5907_07690 [Treponema sp.]|nr:hypothetical protein [Treponema sp.]
MIFAKKDYSRKNILVTLCVLAVALLVNCFGSVFATKITFPLYLDSVMTIGVTALCGLLPGVLCAVLSNGILFLFDYTMLPFMSCHIVTAVLAWLVFVHADKKNEKLPVLERSESYEIDAFLWAGVWAALSNAILGNLIADILFGARVNRQNAECTVQGIFVVTRNLLYSTYLAGFIENITDKMLSAVLSYGLYEGVRRLYKK